MTTERIKQLLDEKRLVVLFRNVPMEQMANVAKALVRGGIKILELTFDQTKDDPNTVFKKSFDIIKAAVGDSLCLGAGTVLNVEQVQAAYEAGAEFIVVLTGKVMTMPGLPKIPAAEQIDIDEDGNIIGIF